MNYDSLEWINVIVKVMESKAKEFLKEQKTNYKDENNIKFDSVVLQKIETFYTLEYLLNLIKKIACKLNRLQTTAVEKISQESKQESKPVLPEIDKSADTDQSSAVRSSIKLEDQEEK